MGEIREMYIEVDYYERGDIITDALTGTRYIVMVKPSRRWNTPLGRFLNKLTFGLFFNTHFYKLKELD